MTEPIDFDHPRVKEFFHYLLRMTGGEYDLQAPISEQRDNLDSIIHACNVMVGELNLSRQEAMRANTHKSQFLANVSHEIRTPIAAVMGFLDELEDSVREESGKKHLERIRFNCRHLLGLVDQMLDLSTIEAGKLKRNKIKIHLREELKNLLESISSKARQKGLKFHFEYDETLPKQIETDSLKLRQIVFNLLNNAVKFTDAGTVTLQVSKKTVGHVQEALTIDIIDTGRGIPVEKQNSIFELFEHYSDKKNDPESGVGLGLPIAKKLAEFLGGDLLLVESSEERGSAFCSFLPVTWIEGAAEATRKHFDTSVPPKRESLSGVKVLLAEDTPDLRMLFEIFLTSVGIQVTAVPDGSHACEKMKAENFDIVLMDVKMPVMDGITATKQIRDMGFKGPILALTAHAQQEQKMECLQAGCNDALIKPVGKNTLLGKIEEFLLSS